MTCSMCFKKINRTIMGGDLCENCDTHKDIKCSKCGKFIGGTMYGMCNPCEKAVIKQNENREKGIRQLEVFC